jgi:hypothetical protein
MKGFRNILLPNDRPKTTEQPKTAEKKEVSEVREQPTPEGRAELKRPKDAELLAKAATELDDRFRKLPMGISPERMRTTDVMETLSGGEEMKMKRKSIGEAGVNGITKREYGEKESISAYVKPQAEEASFRYDAAVDGVIKTQKVFNSETQQMETIDSVEAKGGKTYEEYLRKIPDEWLKGSENPEQRRQELAKDEYDYRRGLVSAFKTRSEYQPTLRAQVAQRYGISPEEVPMTEGVFGPREGIGVNKSAVREYTASRIDKLLGFNVVPVTVLRAEKNEADRVVDVSSVQEAIVPTDPDEPLQTLEQNLYEELLAKGEGHPGARSFMRIACLDYILGSLDRHEKNILYDPKTQEFGAIDNGLSGGISREVEHTAADGTAQTIVETLDPIRSIPLEVVQQIPDWQLDDEAMKNVKFLYERTAHQPAASEIQAAGAAHTEGTSESRIGALIEETLGEHETYLSDLLRLQYENDKIAHIEAQAMLERIGHVMQHGRPPNMKLGYGGGELFPMASKVYPDAKIPEHLQAA